MKLINDNLKKAGIFNSVLIVIAIVLRLIPLKSVPTLVKVDSIICIVALIYGLIYALYGYKKEASKYYKTFMYLYLLSSIISFATVLDFAVDILGKIGILMIIANAIILVSVFLLAFIKDFGEKKSNNFALLVFALNIFKLLFDLIIIGSSIELANISAGFSNIMLSCILCLFVSAKYADKSSRGAK